ncbi:MAG: trypsin-like peptidase domain-containing protein [Alistipes sp.]|nr:trypsin-like peptidase domain-containing protein [Alistipes sp.]
MNDKKEYNFGIESIEEAGGAAPVNDAPQKPKKHIAAKITASLLAMAVVSAGSIGVYSRVAGSGNSSSNEIVEESRENISVSADAMSAIKTEKHGKTELTTEEVVEKVLPSVVGIESEFTMVSDNSYDDIFSGFGSFGNFGGYGNYSQQEPEEKTSIGTGTGVIIDKSGYIVTNAHVIYDSQYGAELADSVSVIVGGEDTYDAEVIGYDTDCDLAVLKIDADGLIAAEFGDSDALKLGESVTAIGNPLGFELMNTVTNGIVSGLDRNITINDKTMNLIQTNAAINSGNSGGPLINKYGQVIGINSAKMSSTYSGEASIEGICFAIPSNKVSDVVDDLMDYGYVTGKPQLGMTCQDVTEEISEMYNMPVGVCVFEVTEDSAADRAGLKKGDIITAVNGKTVTTAKELNAEKNRHEAGDEIEITYIRNGKESTVTVELDEKAQEE